MATINTTPKTIKVTKKQKYQALAVYLSELEPTEAVAENITIKDIIDLCNKEVESLDKKASAKSSKENPEKTAKMAQALNALKALAKPSTITDVIAHILATEGVTLNSQSVSWYLNEAVKQGMVVKTIDKKKSYFEYVGESEDESAED